MEAHELLQEFVDTDPLYDDLEEGIRCVHCHAPLVYVNKGTGIETAVNHTTKCLWQRATLYLKEYHESTTKIL